MWVAGRSEAPRVQRTSSVHSIGSFHSPTQSRSPSTTGLSRSSTTYNNTPTLKSFDSRTTPQARMPQQDYPAPIHNKTQAPAAPRKKTPWELVAEGGRNKTPYELAAEGIFVDIPDDMSSTSSTLDGEEDYMDHVEKKPLRSMLPRKDLRNEEPRSPNPAPHIPGPLESQLAALMSKLIYLEHSNPAVSVAPKDYQDMQKRLKALEEEKKTWWKRHEAIWALRDEDVENNIKIRGMLAKARRELEATKALRDEDLNNVLIVRAKLAEKTRELDRLQAQTGQTGRTSPIRGRPASYLERRGTSDLFVAAKTAALEQRALELEKRNSDLVAQIETLKGGAGIDDLNRLTAHQAWKATVSDLEAKLKIKDAELARSRSGSTSGGSGNSLDWYRVEALLEEHANYRESVGGKLQALRSDKEALQKELHRKENDYQALELRLQTLQRRTTVL